MSVTIGALAIFLGAKAFYEKIDGFCQDMRLPLLDQI
jgi:hypothetical protein